MLRVTAEASSWGAFEKAWSWGVGEWTRLFPDRALSGFSAEGLPGAKPADGSHWLPGVNTGLSGFYSTV